MLLHEIIAVEEGLKTTAIKVVTEARTTFTKKEGHFDGQSKNFSGRTEEDGTKPGEDRPVIETVAKKLDYVLNHMIAAMDIASSKEMTNTDAKAILFLRGNVIAANVPVTTLVQVENKLRALRPLFEDIPTLDATQVWTPVAGSSDTVETAPKIVQSTKKVLVPVVLTPATDKFPAQIEKTYTDVVAGEWSTILRSGRISSLDKSKLLARLDEVIREVKQARQRANSAVVIEQKFATDLFTFILGRPLGSVE